MKRLKPIMFVGTGSDVGKSIINTGLCRIFKQDGFSPAPFKAQNMSLNSFPTKDNREIGRAQAVQAEACGIDCTVEMNPVLLKPISEGSSQVVLNGVPVGNSSASDYFKRGNREVLFAEATKAFDKLRNKYNPIVMEGAGSISEMNLWDKDITNMRMAAYAEASTFLVADIDKGGVFASVYGSVMLLPEKWRRLIKGIIINKFRGDIRLFDEGRKIIEELVGIPLVGVVPYMKDIYIEQEDSVVLDHKRSAKGREDAEIQIGVIRLPSISNFTDFNVLSMCEGVSLRYISTAEEVRQSNIIIIPGSKSTISDMLYLKKSGLDAAIVKHYRADKALYGICGGYQIMGESISDPTHIEGNINQIAGLGILPIKTEIKGGKVTRQCSFTLLHSGAKGKGYEIHAGDTVSDRPLLQMENGESDGYYQSDTCWGTYVHGIFDNAEILDSILRRKTTLDYQAFKEKNYDRLAKALRECIDIAYIYKTLEP